MGVRRCTVDELESAPNFAAVLAEYEAESAAPEVGPVNAQMDVYRALEAADKFYLIASFDTDGNIAGFIAILAVVVPHYGVLTTTVESFFVAKEHRCTGLGLSLLNEAERLATTLGSKAMLVSAPVNGALDRVMTKRKSYRHGNNAYLKALA